MSKKIVSLVVALAMVLTSMSFAFAAVSDDVKDADVKAAVDRLVGFGLVDGIDGKYMPEKTLTRAEGAKLIVAALGLKTAADAAANSQKFADVPVGQWYTGYVNVAEGMGLIKGVGGNMFAPNAEFTYDQVATILVRTLGYKDEFLKGTWPNNYIAKASDLGIDDDVKLVPGTSANRGAVAVMLNNTLDCNIIKQTSFGDNNDYSDEGQPTLLEDKLDITKAEDAIVIATPKVDSSIESDQFQYSYDANEDGDTGDNGENPVRDVDANYKLANIDSLLGLSLNVYLNDSDEVIYVEESDDKYKVIYDVVDSGETIDTNEFTLVNADKEYNWEDDGYTIYVDNEEVDADDSVGGGDANLDDLEDIVADGHTVYGKFVLNNKGNVVMADLHKFDGDEARIVTASDKAKATITYNLTEADDAKTLKLDADAYDKAVIMDTAGKVMNIEDVKKDDIIYVNNENLADDDLEAGDDTVAYVIVVRTSAEGKATTFDADEVEVGDKTYDWSTQNGNVIATCSIDNDKNYAAVTGTTDELEDITDAEASSVVLIDLVGDVRHLRASAESTSDDMYGLITGVDQSMGDTTVKILNSEEKEVTYTLDVDDADWAGSGYADADAVFGDNDPDAFDIVKYTVNKDGDIDYIEKLGSFDGNGGGAGLVAGTATASTLEDDFGTDSMTVDAGGDLDLTVDSKVVMFNAFDGVDGVTYDPADATVVKWDDIKGKNQADDAEVLYVTDDDTGAVIFAVFVDGTFEGASDEMAGYVVDERTAGSDGDTVLYVMLPGASKVEKFTVKNTDALVVDGDETVVVFSKRNDGKVDRLDNTTAADYETVTGVVYEMTGRYITLVDAAGNNLGKYKVKDTAVIAEGDDESIDFSEMEAYDAANWTGSLVRVAIKDAQIEVVKKYDLDKAADVGTTDFNNEEAKLLDAYNVDIDNNADADLADISSFFNRQ